MKKLLLILIMFFTNITILNAASFKNDDQIITINVKNSDNSDYILDILFIEEDDAIDNVIPDLSLSDLEKVRIIKEYTGEEKFTNSLIRGSVETLEGNLKGMQVKGAKKMHTFSYNTFQEDSFGKSSERKINVIKIIVIDENNKVKVSEKLVLKQYSSRIVYDYENHTAVVINPSLEIVLFTLFIIIISLLISFFIFIKMKFNIKDNLSMFGVITGLASITVVILVANALYYDNGLFAFYTLLILGTINVVLQCLVFSSVYKSKKAFAFGLLSSLVNMIVTLLTILLI